MYLMCFPSKADDGNSHEFRSRYLVSLADRLRAGIHHLKKHAVECYYVRYYCCAAAVLVEIAVQRAHHFFKLFFSTRFERVQGRPRVQDSRREGRYKRHS